MKKYYGDSEEMTPRKMLPEEVANLIELLCQAPSTQVDPAIVLRFFDWKRLSLESLPNEIQKAIDDIVNESLASDFVVAALHAFKASVERMVELQEVKT